MDETPVSELSEDQVIRRYDGFVRWVLDHDVRFAGSHLMSRSDAIQEGRIGLLKAHRDFDEGKGVQFITYARPRIRGAIQDALRAVDPLKRKLRVEFKDVEAEHLPERFKFALSLEGLVEVHGDGINVQQDPGRTDDALIAAIDDKLMLERFEAWLAAKLGPRDWELYRLWRGGAKLKAAGEVFGVTESRACQIIALVEKLAAEYGFLMRCEEQLAS